MSPRAGGDTSCHPDHVQTLTSPSAFRPPLVRALTAMADSAAAAHPPKLLGLLSMLSEEEAARLLAALTTPRGGFDTALLGVLRDEESCAELLELLHAFGRMPEGSADRWGAKAAAHSCTKQCCLPALAHFEPELLDELRGRLQAAQDHARAVQRGEILVPPKNKKSRLAHRPEATAGGGESALQAAVAAAAAAAADDREAEQQESELEAAEAVRLRLHERGCCVVGAAAMCHGFGGTSTNFLYWASTGKGVGSHKEAGQTRMPGMSERRDGSSLPPASDSLSEFCCEADCSDGMTEETVIRCREGFFAQRSHRARLQYLADFLWDAQMGRLRTVCDRRIFQIFGFDLVSERMIHEVSALRHETGAEGAGRAVGTSGALVSPSPLLLLVCCLAGVLACRIGARRCGHLQTSWHGNVPGRRQRPQKQGGRACREARPRSLPHANEGDAGDAEQPRLPQVRVRG